MLEAFSMAHRFQYINNTRTHTRFNNAKRQQPGDSRARRGSGSLFLALLSSRVRDTRAA